MRIVDTSVLLPAVNPSLPQHESARRALEAAINDDRPVGLVWVVANAFLRLTTKPGLFERPLPIDGAWEIVDGWLGHANVRVVQETEEHPRLWSELMRSAGTGGDLTTDARSVDLVPLDRITWYRERVVATQSEPALFPVSV